MIHQLLGGAIPMIANIVVLFCICHRILAAAMLRRKIMAEMREVSSNVQQIRENIKYIGEHSAKAVEEIKQDVGEELKITDQLTSQSSKVATMLQRFSEFETGVIEMVRMNGNMENVQIETPGDINEEIRKIVAVIENKRRESQERSENAKDKLGSGTGSAVGAVREHARRNPLSKFSVSGSRDPISERPRIPTTPEVRLLGEPVKTNDRA